MRPNPNNPAIARYRDLCRRNKLPNVDAEVQAFATLAQALQAMVWRQAKSEEEVAKVMGDLLQPLAPASQPPRDYGKNDVFGPDAEADKVYAQAWQRYNP